MFIFMTGEQRLIMEVCRPPWKVSVTIKKWQELTIKSFLEHTGQMTLTLSNIALRNQPFISCNLSFIVTFACHSSVLTHSSIPHTLPLQTCMQVWGNAKDISWNIKLMQSLESWCTQLIMCYTWLAPITANHILMSSKHMILGNNAQLCNSYPPLQWIVYYIQSRLWTMLQSDGSSLWELI